jgi:hypothetical protein
MGLREVLWRVAGFLACPHGDVLSFAREVEAAGIVGRIDAGMATIPAAKIVGSVGRAATLRSDFFAKSGKVTGRYMRIGQAMERGVALPPIEVYRARPAAALASLRPVAGRPPGARVPLRRPQLRRRAPDASQALRRPRCAGESGRWSWCSVNRHLMGVEMVAASLGTALTGREGVSSARAASCGPVARQPYGASAARQCSTSQRRCAGRPRRPTTEESSLHNRIAPLVADGGGRSCSA